MHVTLPLALSLLASVQADRGVHAERGVDAGKGTDQVLDASTGAPIEGATVYGVQEAAAPVWGEFWSQISAVTDAAGWADLPLPADGSHYGWVIVRAEGYAPTGSMAVPRQDVEIDPVELVRAEPATIRVVDFLGRPAQLVHLGFCVGCGHTPDVMSAVSDRSGVAVLECVGRGDRNIADIYPVADGVLTDYLHIDWDAAMDGGYEAMVEPGVTITGRVFKADGTPAGGYAVGQPRRHRGPWARTEKDGSFHLYGLPLDGSVSLRVKDPAGLEVAIFDGARPGVERILRLPEERYGDTEPVTDARLALTVTVPPTPGVEAIPVPGRVWDPRTGWCTRFEATPGETSTLELPAGSLEVEIGGGSSPYLRRSMGRVELVADADPLAVTADLPAVRVVRLEIEGIDGESNVYATAEDGEWIEIERDRYEERDGVSIGVVERAVLPAEPFGLWLNVQEKGRDHALLEVDGLLEGADVLRAKRR